MKAYISGPITGTPDYLDKFAQAEEVLTSQGHEVINPARTNATLPTSTTYNQYMNMCYLVIDMFETIVMLEDWEKSKGACIEYGYAMGKDMMIVDFRDMIQN